MKQRLKIYMIGIGGIAMGNLAYMLKEAGHYVSGSDQKLYPPMSDKLQEWGLITYEGFNEENLGSPDLVIIGNAISRGNPEVEAVLNRGIDYMSMSAAISHFFLKQKKVIVVAGTHGKTTTSFLIHHILKSAGFNPGLFVGGIRKDGNAGFELGTGDYFVIEGDEYDSAFFDKSSKFLHYRPFYLALTSLDFDHADIFKDIDAIKIMFKRLLNLVPSKGKIFYYKNSKNLSEILENFSHAPKEEYDISQKNSYLEIKNDSAFSKFRKKVLDTNLLGQHNLRNSEVAYRICKEIGLTDEEILYGIETFPGVKRRQEVLYEDEKSVIIEDFAHHPVAIEETISAIKMKYKTEKLISLFEPRSATSHRNVFQKEFSGSFKKSDLVIITEIFNLNKVDKKNRLNVKKLVLDTKKLSKVKTSLYAKDPNELLTKLKKELTPFSKEKICILAMSNGAFGGIYPKLISMVSER